MRDPLGDALRWTRTPIVVFSLLVAAFLLLPVGIVVSTSFSAAPFLVFPPSGFTFHWYGAIVHDSQWMQPFYTSLRVGALATALATIMGTSAALGLRRLRLRGRALAAAFVAPIALPFLAYGLGLYDLVTKVSFLQNSNVPVAIGESVLAFPIVFVIVSAGLAGIDPRITDAASTLGARWPTVVWRVELPLIRTSIIASILFAFSFTTQTSMRTLSAGLLYMVGQYEVQWGQLSAGVILSTVPVAVLFTFLQRHLIHGLTAGAVKG